MKPAILLSVSVILAAGCSKKEQPAPQAKKTPPVTLNLEATEAALPPPVPPPPGKSVADAEATPAAVASAPDAGSEYAASLNKLQKYKKWVSQLMNGSDNDKAQVRRSYQQLSAAEKNEFENYCRSCALKFP